MVSKKQKLELTWIGKDNRPKLEPRILLEDTAKSYHAAHRVTDNDLFDNKLIFGDNLLALKALEQEFTGKIKCIYIDPPYNTGSAFEHYDDGVEHSLWLSLIRDRLEILRSLLTKDGSIWISIDDNEAHYLKVLCDEIFGRANFVATMIWEKRKSRENRRVFSFNHDYVLVFAKDKPSFESVRNLVGLNDEVLSRYKNPDDDSRGPWQSVSANAQAGHATPSQFYKLRLPSGRSLLVPSLCFALATGVGKTRLMGAFIAYLHLAKGINNFFVLAPNLTIYNKLIADFTPNTPKYVFKGIAEFATDAPEIITGDTYDKRSLFGDIYRVRINIFNISKINSEVRGGNAPRIKRLSEYIGQSYFDYLAGLPDLVLLMDESHRYRASAGIRAINELKPMLGLELTATPFVETSKGAIPFKNVVYDYLSEEDTVNVLQFHQQQLAALIHSQMQLPKNRWEKATGYKATVSKGFSALKENAYTASATDDIRPFRMTVSDPANIKKYVFGGFSKCLYDKQKFDVDAQSENWLPLKVFPQFSDCPLRYAPAP